jgi:ubiquinone/menaquinone biosynthesis C-methylase UbiE
MGDRWLANLDRFEGMIAPIGAALLKRAGFKAGEQVVDVGCGAGGTSIDIARQVHPGGSVLGVDIAPQLVAAAVRRAKTAGLDNVRFHCADAAVARLDGPPRDRLYSRFGLMFFAEAPAAFANLRTFIRTGGRADFAVWAPARENAWVAQIMAIMARYVELPAPTPRTPGPFALDDPDYIHQLLQQGGFRQIQIDSWTGDQFVGGPLATPRQATDFVFQALSFARMLEEATPDATARVGDELTALFARHHHRDGVRMAATAFLVSATA